MAQTGSSGLFKVGGLLMQGGVITMPINGAPTSGTSGTFAGLAAPGSRVIDYATGTNYVNTGTTASPTWTESPAVLTASVTLTNAQMLALRAAPVTLVAAPGAGLRLEFLAATLNGDLTGAYTETADNMAIRYVDGSGVIVSQTIEATGFVDQTGGIHTNAQPKIDAIATDAQCVNVALVLHNTGDGEYGGGNAANSVKVTVTYRLVATL